MEKCPKCEQWTAELDIIHRVIKCYRFECDYEEVVSVEKYFDENNDLPILAKSLALYRKSTV